jgi:type IV pilus assembly protein PilY1
LAIAALCFLFGLPTRAATLGLTDTPLFVTNTVQPNIFFTFDDSGSMSWGFLPDSVGGNLLHDDRRGCAASVNGMYYDPAIQYDPPLNENGDELNATKTSFTAAYTNGYNTGAGTVNLSTSYRVTWDPINYFSSNAYAGCGFSGATTLSGTGTGTDTTGRAAFYFKYNTGCGNVNDNLCYDLVQHNNMGAGGAWSASDQQNFANWYSYYRTRSLAARTAASRAFAKMGTDFRIAYQRLNNCTAAFGTTPTASCPGTIVKPFSGTDRTNFFNWLYASPASGGTPLRGAAKRVGDYLLTNTANSPWAQTPGTSKGTEYTCRQNYQILFTDGIWNGNSGFDVGGNVDGTGKTLPDGRSYSTASSPIYADASSNNLADVAFKYWSTDLRTDLTNNVTPYVTSPTTFQEGVDDISTLADSDYFNPDNDPATWQHLVTFTVGFGLPGNLNPANYFDRSLPDSAGDYDELLAGGKTWGATAADDPDNVDDLWHAALDGRGQYFSARDPETLVNSFTSVLESVTAKAGSAAALAVSSGTLNTGTAIYQAIFNSGTWAGQLLSFKVDSNGKVATTPTWDAGEYLNQNQNYDSGREIITYSRSSNDGVAFRWASLDATAQGLLNKDPLGTVDSKGSERLDYLRGATVNEDGAGNEGGSSLNFRSRSCYDKNGDPVTCVDDNGRLGDIVDSAPTLVGKPNGRYTAASYKTFITNNAGRKSVIYVGANDGMLHAFDAANGKELLGYVPGLVHDKLSGLTRSPFVHRQLVNGEISTGDVEIGADNWRTVLVGGLNKGGRGYYALDVTDPGTFSESKASSLVLWEFTDTDLGYSYSQPYIAKMANGKWAAIFGNGYNNVSPGNGHAILYIVFIEDGMDGTWSASDFVKIDTGNGSTTTPNGLSSPVAADIDGDFVADIIYAGDQKGNLWRFVVSSANTGDWTNASNFGVLFTATDGASVGQPITSRPSVGFHPDGYVGTMVFFGTGKYLEGVDTQTSGAQTQTFYGIWDRMKSAVASNLVLKTDLLTQTLSLNGTGIREVTDTPIVWRAGTPAPSPSYLGWKVSLPDPGERQITDSVLREGRIIFTTLIPSSDPCTPAGSGWLMELDSGNGGRLNDTFDTDGDGDVDDDDRITSGGKDFGASGVLQDNGAPSQPVIVYDPTGGGGAPKVCTEYKLTSRFDGSVGSTEEACTPQRGAWRQLK